MPGTSSAPEALAEAVKSNDAAAVRDLLERKPELRARLDDPMPGGHFGATPLLAAVHHGNAEMIDVLLRAGANINQRSHWWAGSFGVLDHDGPLTEFLIARGATVDVHAAARLGMLDRLDALLSVDPSLVHARGGDGQTPLHFAKSLEAAAFLLDRGADIDAPDVDHESTPAQWMVRDRSDVAKFLVSRGCRTDILLAAALGDLPLVEQHLAADPHSVRITVSEEFFPKQDPRSGGTIYNWTLGTGKGPHVVAHDGGQLEVFQLLMDRSPADLQLSVSCEVGDAERARGLLARHPGLAGTIDPAGHRKLPDAARDATIDAVHLMLEAGWPINARGQHGGTALHWAAWNGNLDMTRELLQRGAGLELRDEDFDGTPLRWAVYASVHGWRCATGQYAAVVEALLDAGAEPPDAANELEATAAVRDVLVRRRAPR